MKTTTHPRGVAFGLTLPELTLTLSIILALIGLLFAGSSIYAARADKASCVMAQDQIRKSLIAHAHLNGIKMKPGVDYYKQAVESGALGEMIRCPEGGGTYTATIDPLTGQLVVTCADHGDDHR